MINNPIMIDLGRGCLLREIPLLRRVVLGDVRKQVEKPISSVSPRPLQVLPRLFFRMNCKMK